MTSNELKKYLGEYVSFEINDLAFLPKPEVEGKDMRDNNHHIEGILCANTGARSHFRLDTELGGVAILDYTIPFIENFKVIKEN